MKLVEISFSLVSDCKNWDVHAVIDDHCIYKIFFNARAIHARLKKDDLAGFRIALEKELEGNVNLITLRENV